MATRADLRARVLPLRGAVLVVDVVDASVGLHAALPAGGQRAEAVVRRGRARRRRARRACPARYRRRRTRCDAAAGAAADS